MYQECARNEYLLYFVPLALMLEQRLGLYGHLALLQGRQFPVSSTEEARLRLETGHWGP